MRLVVLIYHLLVCVKDLSYFMVEATIPSLNSTGYHNQVKDVCTNEDQLKRELFD